VTLERGPQCGHHLWLSVGMHDLSQRGTITVAAASVPGAGITVPATAVPYAYAPAGEGCELVGLRFQLDSGAATVSDFLGKPLDLRVEASDRQGRKAAVTRRILVAPSFTDPTGRPCD
jgi:hypothetical protein